MIGQGYVINDDLLGIAERIKALDPDYFVFYSYEKKRFEVHNRRQKGGTLAVILPYDRLDERSFIRVAKTRVENRSKLLEELERDNIKVEKRLIEQAVKRAEIQSEAALSGKEAY